jgi:hypothetical protein
MEMLHVGAAWVAARDRISDALCKGSRGVESTSISKQIAAAFCVILICSFACLSTALAATALMAMSGTMGVGGAAVPGDMQIPVNNFAQPPNVANSGNFIYSIPIQVPPGTHGMVPHLALAYSSASGDGYVGIGWSVSGLSVITRCPQTVAQDGERGGTNFDANDRFCLDGQRLILTGGTYGADGSTYQTEISTFSSITAHGQVSTDQPEYFTVVAKNGMQYEYGNPNVECTPFFSPLSWVINHSIADACAAANSAGGMRSAEWIRSVLYR